MGEKAIARMVASAVVAGAAFTAKKVLDRSWQAATGNHPPSDPKDPDLDWKEAVAWALLTGAVVGIAQLTAARGAHRFLRRHEAA
ncbi:MAG TPA: DUF4235 domain-containing protein [Cryptosporangiaceae bacterium]|nr:DUF4235 domain-containing protein [Cryptosporangiaceae bacterium]